MIEVFGVPMLGVIIGAIVGGAVMLAGIIVVVIMENDKMASPYLYMEAKASTVAKQHLRGFSDADLARMEAASATHMLHLCERFATIPTILLLAIQYEQQRRRAFGGAV